jgi:ERF superfamily
MNDKPEPETKPPVPAIASEPKPPEPPPAKPLAASSPPMKVGKISGAIAAVMGEIGVVAKQGTNQFHRYKYAQMQDILQQLTPLLAKHGLVIWQTECDRSWLDGDRVVQVQYSFRISHSSGEVWPEPMLQTGVCRARDSKGGFDDKAINKCHTAARKYMLLALFQIPTGDVDDADHGPAVKRSAKPAYDDKIPDFDAEDAAGNANSTADEPAAPEKEQAPPDQGAAGASVLRIAEIKARQGRDALMAYSEMLSVADRKILSANIEHLKALYPK